MLLLTADHPAARFALHEFNGNGFTNKFIGQLINPDYGGPTRQHIGREVNLERMVAIEGLTQVNATEPGQFCAVDGYFSRGDELRGGWHDKMDKIN